MTPISYNQCILLHLEAVGSCVTLPLARQSPEIYPLCRLYSSPRNFNILHKLKFHSNMSSHSKNITDAADSFRSKQVRRLSDLRFLHWRQWNFKCSKKNTPCRLVIREVSKESISSNLSQSRILETTSIGSLHDAPNLQSIYDPATGIWVNAFMHVT